MNVWYTHSCGLLETVQGDANSAELLMRDSGLVAGVWV